MTNVRWGLLLPNEGACPHCGASLADHVSGCPAHGYRGWHVEGAYV